MILLSGNNKSASQQTNDERSKAQQGATALHNSHQQGNNKGADSSRAPSSLNTNLTKGMTTMDEFKYGFPSEGLSATANKWWGSRDRDDCASTKADGAKRQLEEKASGEAENMEGESGNAESNEPPKGAALLTAARKRAVEEGREVLKLGVFRGYGVNKLGKREKILLRQIFRSSLPSSWIHDS